MPVTLDNQILLYLIIGLFIVQFLVMRYYVNQCIEYEIHRNNKKIVKKIIDHTTMTIASTFEQYMGSANNMQADECEGGKCMRRPLPARHANARPTGRPMRHADPTDSVDDPLENGDDDDENDDNDDANDEQ